MKHIKKGIAIAGGGANGDFTAGKLFELKPAAYQVGHGISTGALMLLAVMTGNWNVLEAYTLITNRDIFNNPPFNKKGFPRIGYWIRQTAKSLVSKKVRTLSETWPLKALIDSYYSTEDFNNLHKDDKIAIIGAYSLTQCRIHNAKSNFIDFETFKNFMFASACAGPLMSIPVFKRCEISQSAEEWTDGGLEDNFNVDILFENGCTEVDLYLHRARKKKKPENKKPIQNIIHYGIRFVQALFKSNYNADIKVAIDAAMLYKGILRIHYMPEELAERNPFVFDAEQMKEGFKEGMRLAHDQSLIETYNYSK